MTSSNKDNNSWIEEPCIVHEGGNAVFRMEASLLDAMKYTVLTIGQVICIGPVELVLKITPFIYFKSKSHHTSAINVHLLQEARWSTDLPKISRYFEIINYN